MVINQATRYEVIPIQMIHMKKVKTNSFGYFLQSGVVRKRTKEIGQVNIHQHFPEADSSAGHSQILVDSSVKKNSGCSISSELIVQNVYLIYLRVTTT